MNRYGNLAGKAFAILGVGGMFFGLVMIGADRVEAEPAVVAKKSGKAGTVSFGPAGLTDKILLDLEAKRRAIAQKEIEIQREERRLMELRADIKKRVATLKKIEESLQKKIQKVDSANNKSITHLVRAYSAMGPDEAAKLMNTMDIKLAVRILRNMQVKKAGRILAVVEPRRAARISEQLARAKIRN